MLRTWSTVEVCLVCRVRERWRKCLFEGKGDDGLWRWRLKIEKRSRWGNKKERDVGNKALIQKKKETLSFLSFSVAFCFFPWPPEREGMTCLPYHTHTQKTPRRFLNAHRSLTCCSCFIFTFSSRYSTLTNKKDVLCMCASPLPLAVANRKWVHTSSETIVKPSMLAAPTHLSKRNEGEACVCLLFMRHMVHQTSLFFYFALVAPGCDFCLSSTDDLNYCTISDQKRRKDKAGNKALLITFLFFRDRDNFKPFKECLPLLN